MSDIPLWQRRQAPGQLGHLNVASSRNLSGVHATAAPPGQQGSGIELRPRSQAAAAFDGWMQENPLHMSGLGSIKMSIRPMTKSPSRQQRSPSSPSGAPAPAAGLPALRYSDSLRQLSTASPPNLVAEAPEASEGGDDRAFSQKFADCKEESTATPVAIEKPSVSDKSLLPHSKSAAPPPQKEASEDVGEFLSDRSVSSATCCTLHPQKSKFMKVWDLQMVIVLLIVALVTPYEVAFLDTSLDGLFVANRIVDGLFLVDMILQFFLAYRRPDGLWVFAHKRLAKRYLKGWFWIDLISICPFDIMGLVMENDTVTNLRVLRIVRLARLAKLARMLHIGIIFRRWETALRIDYSFLSLFKFLSGMLVIAHWLACVWELVAVFENDAVVGEVVAEPGQYPSWQYYAQVVGEDAWSRYLVALYFSLVTMATTGYGDVIPVTTVERWFVIFAMMLGAGIWTYIVANITNIVARLDREMHFKSALDDLNQYCSEHKLTADTREQLRTYLHQKKQIIQEINPMKLLEEMSPALRSEVCREVYGEWMQRVSYLRGFGSLEPLIHSELALQLEHHVFAPQEMITRKALHVVEKGVIVKEGIILSSKSMWGEDMVLSSPILESFTPTVRCLTFVEVLVLDRSRFYAVISKYPAVHQKVRRAMLWLLVKRGIKVLSLVLRSYRAALEESGGPVSPEPQKDFTISVSPPIAASASTPPSDEEKTSPTWKLMGSSKRRWRSITTTQGSDMLEGLRDDVLAAHTRDAAPLSPIPSVSEYDGSDATPATSPQVSDGEGDAGAKRPPWKAPPPPPPRPANRRDVASTTSPASSAAPRGTGDLEEKEPVPDPDAQLDEHAATEEQEEKEEGTRPVASASSPAAPQQGGAMRRRPPPPPPLPRLSETRNGSFSQSLPLLTGSKDDAPLRGIEPKPTSRRASKTRRSILLHRAAELALGARRWSKLPHARVLERDAAASSQRSASQRSMSQASTHSTSRPSQESSSGSQEGGDSELQFALDKLHSIAQLSAPLRRRHEVYMASASSSTLDTAERLSVQSPSSGSLFMPQATPQRLGLRDRKPEPAAPDPHVVHTSVSIKNLEERLWENMKTQIETDMVARQ